MVLVSFSNFSDIRTVRMGPVKASSSTAGFFQELPVVPPQYTSSKTSPGPSEPSDSNTATSDDPALPRVLSLYLPTPTPREISKHLHDFSRLVLSPSTLRHTVDCETDQPTLHPLNTFGEENKASPLRTGEGWRALKRIQTRAGVVGHGYAHPSIHAPFNRRVHQFATLQLWDGTAALTTCPMAMTDGAAVLLRRHLQDADDLRQPGRADVFLESYHRLISLDPTYAWTSGQWMTERTGGSDVSGTETVARLMTPQELECDAAASRDKDAHGLPLGPWSISGYKWFSSATDADMTILLAQTGKGLSAFYAPLRRRVGDSHQTEMNGVRPIRLKSKLGTKGLPTAELEVSNMRAYLIGEQGQGVKEISSILNITRLHTARGGAGYLARGLAVSRAYTRVRRVRGGLLSDNPQHLAWMAGETVKYVANTHLVFFGVALLGASEQGHDTVTRGARAAGTGGGGGGVLLPREKETADLLLRIVTPVMKSQVSMNSVSGLRACMESLGGVGYCENNEDGGILNIARLFRDSVVGTIWEGTTSVMAEDVLRVIKNSKTKQSDVLDSVFGTWTRRVLKAVQNEFTLVECWAVSNRYKTLKDMVDRLDMQQLLRRGREILEHVEAVACACLLMYDACSDGDEVAKAIAKRWIRSNALPADVTALAEEAVDWKKEVEMDRRIFLGSDTTKPNQLPARL